MLTSILAGLSGGAIYAVIAVGYNVTSTAAGVLNFAFANIVMMGGYFAITWLGLGIPTAIAILLSGLCCCVVAIIEERVAIRLLPSGGHAELVTTIGTATLLTGITILVWGVDPRGLKLFDDHPISILGGTTLPNNMVVLGLAVLAGIGLHVWLRHTRHGLASRAQATDREAAMLRGVHVRWLALIAFAASGLFAGIVGPFVVMSVTAAPTLAITLALKGFIAVSLGGLGSPVGAVLGGLGIGLAESLSSYWIGPNYGDFAIFAIFVLVLLFRPHGIFGHYSLRSV